MDWRLHGMSHRRSFADWLTGYLQADTIVPNKTGSYNRYYYDGSGTHIHFEGY